MNPTRFLRFSLPVVLAAALAGCSSDAAPKHVTSKLESFGPTKAYVMTSHGAEVLKVTTVANAKCVATDGALHFNRELPYEVEFWVVPRAATVDEVLPRVPMLIKSEFVEFKPSQATDLTVAGAPAKRLTGPGREADDNDPGSADVVVFKVGSHVFVACNHGEGLDAPTQQRMLDMLRTVQAP